MTQDQKELLLKDLCVRLPYGVKFPMMCWDDKIGETIRPVTLYSINQDGYCRVSEDDYSPYIDEVKPYLFPLSSMTNEQLFEVSEILGKDVVIFSDYLLTINNCRKSFSYQELDTLFIWFDKNHFDYRGLIPMGLAEDATGLNIY